VIETERVLQGRNVLLRPLAARDLRRCVKWYNDPRVTQFLGRTTGVSLAEQERWFRDYERKPDEQVFAIEVDGRHIGNLGFHHVNRVHRKADLGIVIGEPTAWSKGIGTEAIRLALGYAFVALGLNKVSLDVLEDNARAIRTYEKVGFQREGVHREDLFKSGRFLNVVRMGILAREWQKGLAPEP